jgi:4-diphosphocytidyl-2-C-methyl-D-erythritol kinase
MTHYRTHYTVHAPAKLNLTLSVGPRREDGYHDLASWMHPLALADTLHVTLSSSPGLRLSIASAKSRDSAAFVATEGLSCGPDNLIHKAFTLYTTQNPFPKGSDVLGLDITLEKAIPIQAGLGGGSADAAAMLRFLNTQHPTPLSKDALVSCARELGADVPFGLLNQSLWAEGVGERLTALAPLASNDLFLVKPRALNISTPVAFQALDEDRFENSSLRCVLSDLPSAQTVPPIGSNDFEAPMRKRFEALETVFEVLAGQGVRGYLTGSGPTVFVLRGGLSPVEQARLQAAFPQEAYWSCWTTL